jgi:hypothetical protein
MGLGQRSTAGRIIYLICFHSYIGQLLSPMGTAAQLATHRRALVKAPAWPRSTPRCSEPPPAGLTTHRSTDGSGE